MRPARFPWDCTVIGPSKGKWSEGGGQSDGEGKEGERESKLVENPTCSYVLIDAQLFATEPSITFLLGRTQTLPDIPVNQEL